MLGKLVDGVLITPSEYERKKIIITNPSDESLKFNMGYKELIIDEEPEYDAKTQYIEPEYEETDVSVIQHWVIKDIEEVMEENINE